MILCIVEDNRIDRLIQETFAQMDDDNFHDIHDLPLLNKEKLPVYEASRENIISTTLLLMNLKVLDGL